MMRHVQVTDDEHGGVRVSFIGWLRAHLRPVEKVGLKIDLFELHKLVDDQVPPARRREGMWLLIKNRKQANTTTAWLRRVADEIDKLTETWTTP